MAGIAIHGGAGTILKSKMTPEKEAAYRTALEEALLSGWNCLKDGKSAVDAVTMSVEVLENNPLFNAGRGSVFTHDGTQRMDASIMDGETLNAGSVSYVKNIKNPILLARKVMEESEFVFLNGNGAEEFARKMNLKFENDEYFFDQYRFEQFKKAIEHDRIQLDHSDGEEKTKKSGTVGAVALDSNGNLAAATSTGGMTNMKFGRIGDSPVIGAGTYANNKTCAVSCTGHGEFFIRCVAAFDVSALMEYRSLTLREACDLVVHKKLKDLGGDGGLIAIDRKGNIEMTFNSEGMYRASISDNTELKVGIYSS